MYKKLQKALWGLMTMVALTGLTSCDEDTQMSWTLSGQWFGDFGMFYDYEDRLGRVTTYYSTESDIYFEPNSSFSTRGVGWQRDYYRYGPYKYMYYKFYWYVRDGVLYLEYPYDRQLDTYIYDYRLRNGHFMGRLGDSHTGFDLVKVDIYDDWSYYLGERDYYYYYYDEYPLYAPSRSAGEEPQPEGRIVRRGNRWNSVNGEK